MLELLLLLISAAKLDSLGSGFSFNALLDYTSMMLLPFDLSVKSIVVIEVFFSL